LIDIHIKPGQEVEQDKNYLSRSSSTYLSLSVPVDLHFHWTWWMNGLTHEMILVQLALLISAQTNQKELVKR
jgi:hypothetical protein